MKTTQADPPVTMALPASGDHRPVTVRRPRPPFRPLQALRVLAAHRDLLFTLTAHRIRVRYKQSALGWCWAVLQPLALMLIFTVVFSRIARISADGIPYPLFAYSGLLVWSSMATGLSNATHSLTAHAGLITQVYFPREIIPLTYVAAALFDVCTGSLVLGLLLAWHGHALTWHALYVVPIVIVLAALLTAVSFLLSAIQVRFRDIGMAVPLILYLWMFATPIAYPLSAVPASYRPWFLLNPMTGLVDSFRRAVLHGAAPDPAMFATPALVAAILLPVAYAFFKRVEVTMADVI